MIPGLNDNAGETADMCQWIADNLGADVPLHFTAFHPDYKMLDIGSTPMDTLQKARDIALNCAEQYVVKMHHPDKKPA